VGNLRLRVRLAALAVVAAAVAAPAAGAGLIGSVPIVGGAVAPNCGKGAQVFAPWGDHATYYPVQNGGLESGSSGWTLTGGASVVRGNEPFYISGPGAYSLSLPSGSTATSPATCIGTANLFIRMLGIDAGGRDSGLRIRVIFRGGLLSSVLGVLDFTTTPPTGTWQPTLPTLSLGSLGIPLGSQSMQIQLSPVGSGSAWRIDDLYVDPWANGIV
jgi:hypothetical protein